MQKNKYNENLNINIISNYMKCKLCKYSRDYQTE